jgi:uncharacterized phage-associated protein
MTPAMNFKDLPVLVPKKQKLLASILLLIEEAAKAGWELSKGEIVKSLFVADDKHLAKYGRPITFDNYVAMENGPVGDITSDLLNEYEIVWADYGLDKAPWTTRKDDAGRVYYCLDAVASNRRKLSPSDVGELTSALGHVKTLGFGRISHETHKHPAWAAAWSAKDETARGAAMDWRDFPMADSNAISDLAMASWNAS